MLLFGDSEQEEKSLEHWVKRDPEFLEYCRQRLVESELFAGLDPQLLVNMLSLSRREHWRRGMQLDPVLFKKRFYLIVEGRVELTRVNPQTGRTLTLFLLGPGDGIDIVSLLTRGHHHEITPEAVGDVVLVSVSMEDARRWLDAHPEFNRNFLPYLGKQISYLEDLATDLGLHDTMTRLARLILRHVRKDGGAPVSAGSARRSLFLINDLHDESLARLVGSVRQVVNRHLQHWRKEGVLGKYHLQNVVTDLEALSDYAEQTAKHVEANTRRLEK